MSDKTKDLSTRAEPFVLTVLRPIIAAADQCMPLHEAIKHSRNPAIVRMMDEVVLHMIVRLADGLEVSENMRTLIACWAEKQIRQRDRKKGHPRDSAKRLAVYLSYRQKLAAEPKRKRESIVRDLELEFGLKRRRVWAIIRRVSRTAAALESSPVTRDLFQELTAP